MSTVAVWFLVIMLPIEGAGRQIGPFASEDQCKAAEAIYSQRQRSYVSRMAACVQGVAIRQSGEK